MTDEQARERAIRLYASQSDDDVEIDDDARVTHLTDDGPCKGAAWVQAWVYVPALDSDD